MGSSLPRGHVDWRGLDYEPRSPNDAAMGPLGLARWLGVPPSRSSLTDLSDQHVTRTCHSGTLHNGWKLVEAEEMPVSEPGVEEHRAGGGRGGDTCACASAGADGQQLLAVQDGNGQQRASCGAGVAGGGVGADLGRMPYRYRLRFASSDPEHGAPTEESRGEEQQGQEARGLEVRAKVVIGADGYFSRVRRVVSRERFPEARASRVAPASWPCRFRVLSGVGPK